MTQLVLALVAVPVVVVALFMCLREPMRVALPAYAALIPFGGGLAVGSARFGSLSSLVGLALGLGLVLQFLHARRAAARLSPTVPVWLLFLGLSGASVLWSIMPSETLSGFLILSSLIVVYVFVSLSHVDRVVLRRTENGLLAGAVLAVCYGLTQLLFLGGFPSDVPALGPAPDGRFGNDLLGPDNEAVALLLPLVIALSRSVTQPGRSTRLLHALLAAILLTGTLMTGSRGGLLTSAVAAVTLVCATPRRGRRRLLAYGALGLAAASVVDLPPRRRRLAHLRGRDFVIGTQRHLAGRPGRLPPLLPSRIRLGDLPGRLCPDPSIGAWRPRACRQGRRVPTAQPVAARRHRARASRSHPGGIVKTCGSVCHATC